MDSKMQEEVKKRRGKPSPVNIYQRLVLLAGAAVLVFAVWTTPASLPAVGVIGTTLLIFFILKDSKEKQDKGKRIDPKETLPEAGQNVDLREMSSEAGENVNPQEMLPKWGRMWTCRRCSPNPRRKNELKKWSKSKSWAGQKGLPFPARALHGAISNWPQSNHG